MVVKGLEKYMEVTPGLTYKDNLRNLILKESSYSFGSKNKPVIVFDASSTTSMFHPKGLGFGCNGQPKKLRANIEKFVKDITSLGAFLVVVLRGNPSENISCWRNKNRISSKKICDALEKLRTHGTFFDDIPYHNSYAIYFCGRTSFASIKNDNYMVFSATENTVTEVVGSLRKLNGFAVIGQNSEYLIYEDVKKFISAKSIDLETLDCVVFNRQALLKHLRLEFHHLPVFASLCGNDIISYCSVIPFQKTISHLHKDPMLAMAEVVRNVSENPRHRVRELVKLIHAKNVDERLVKKSLDTYLQQDRAEELAQTMESITKRKILDIALLKEKSSLFDKIIVRLLKKKEFRVSLEFENLLDPNIRPASLFLTPLREKIYGILLHESENKVVTEFEIHRSDEGRCVFTNSPRCEHPGLESLWTKESGNVERMRWDLFCSSVSRKLDRHSLRKIPAKLLIPVAALHHLAVEVPISTSLRLFQEDFEVKAFLTTALMVCSEVEVEDVEEEDPHYRALDLSSKFLSCCVWLALLNESCGFLLKNEDACPCNYFDGVLFQSVYKKMRKGADCNEFFGGNDVLGATFLMLMDTIMT